MGEKMKNKKHTKYSVIALFTIILVILSSGCINEEFISSSNTNS